MPGLSTGLTDLDRAISGLNKSDLILLAARPGMGKTSMALNILLHAGKFSGKSVVFFSLEMSREQLAMRLISSECLCGQQKAGHRQAGPGGLGARSTAASDGPEPDEDFHRRQPHPVRGRHERQVPPGGEPGAGGHRLPPADAVRRRAAPYAGENRQQVVSDISRALKIMAKELNVPVLCLSQLSRANESRSDKRPMLSDLRESGAIEQDADIVMFLYRDDYYNKDSDKPQSGRVHHRQEPPRRDPHGGAPVAAGVHHLLLNGAEI